ncbi:MAG: hypothetical protein BGN91_05405 [Nitrobacter sp. 62-13]|jgi:hypothetical protein|nr:MAG: hypothetical protein BGN91_05405 [Nitrobacter sp. 62-13]
MNELQTRIRWNSDLSKWQTGMPPNGGLECGMRSDGIRRGRRQPQREEPRGMVLCQAPRLIPVRSDNKKHAGEAGLHYRRLLGNT